jgi:sigma54-dependent transcription regulator
VLEIVPIVGGGTDTFAENCQKLPKMTQICEKSLKTHVKGTKNGANNGCEGLLRAACKKSF